MKSFSVKFLSLSLPLAGVYYLLYLTEGISAAPFIYIAGDFSAALAVYVLCLFISPFVSLSISRSGKLKRFLFALLFTLLTSGSLYFLLPFFEVISTPLIACVASAFFPVLALTSYQGIKYIKAPDVEACVIALENRGFNRALINRKIFLKALFSGLLSDAYKILGYILLIFMPAQVIGRYNGIGTAVLTGAVNPLTAFCALTVSLLSFGLFFMFLDRIFIGNHGHLED